MMRKTKLLFNQFLSYFLISLFVITQSLVAMEEDDYYKLSRFFKTFSEERAWDRNRADSRGEALNQHLFSHHVGVSADTTHDRILRQNEEPIRTKADAVQLMCGICNGYVGKDLTSLNIVKGTLSRDNSSYTISLLSSPRKDITIQKSKTREDAKATHIVVILKKRQAINCLSNT